MKKKLLFLGIIATGIISFKADAQLALENFDAGVLPTGWVLINDGHTVSTGFTTVPGLPAELTDSAWYPISGTYSGIGGASDYQMITTSLFTPAATADRWLITPSFTVPTANTVIKWDDDDLGSGESIELKVSPTAGTTAGTFTSTIYGAPAGSGGLVTHYVPIGAFMGSTIRIAFRDSVNNNWGLLVDNVQTTTLPYLDLGVTTLYIPPFVQTGSSNTISGIIHNYGIDTTTSVHINYSVNGGAPVSTPLTGLSNPLGSDYTFTSGTPWVPASAGTYTVKVWGDNINGAGVDENNANDTSTATVVVIDTVQPKTVLVEEFNQASCDPCAEATPNLDSVYVNNLSNAIMVRYHVNFPGRDCMDSVTLSPFVSARLSYYSVSGVPDAQVDGQYVYPGAGAFTTGVLAEARSTGSPFKITVNDPTYDATKQEYSFSATIKAYGAIPSGLQAFAALTVDTMTYAANQSTESIPQTMFPEVAENMFPNSSGTALTAFTAGSTQTITGSWVKNHPWASDYKVWTYDSSLHGKIVVWVQDNKNQYVYQAGYAVVNTVYSTPVGINAVINNSGSMDIYPNPASKTANVALNLTTGADVKLEVYNAVGQLVYSMPSQYRNAGLSHSTIDVSNFASGTYFVRVTIGNEATGNELLNKTISIQNN